MAGGVAFEFVTSAGRASKRDYAVSATIGALPIGLGFRAGAKGASKVRKLHKFGRHHPSDASYGAKVAGAASQRPGHFPNLSLRPEARAIGSGVAANVIVGMAYDAITHSSSGAGSRAGSRTTTTQSSRRHGPYSSHRSRRSASSGRRRKRCTHRDKRGRQCLRPAGHSGRHRYQ
jgi:hypothetical protein